MLHNISVMKSPDRFLQYIQNIFQIFREILENKFITGYGTLKNLVVIFDKVFLCNISAMYRLIYSRNIGNILRTFLEILKNHY